MRYKRLRYGHIAQLIVQLFSTLPCFDAEIELRNNALNMVNIKYDCQKMPRIKAIRFDLTQNFDKKHILGIE